MKQRSVWVLLFAACVLHAGAVTPVTAQETEALGDDYVAGDFGRLLYQENGVTVRRASVDSDPSLERVAGLNAPIFPGDGVITAFDQRAEIQLAGGSLVRIDRATDVTFLAMPDPYAEVADNTVLQLELGVIRINALLTGDSEFRIDTPTATVFLLGDADLRVAVDNDGTTYIASHRGVVEVTVGDGSVLLRSGTKTTVYPDGAPGAPVSFNTLRGDGFDRWVAKRDAELREDHRYAGNFESYDEIPEEVQPYYRELSRNGRWVNSDEYGWVWYPTGVASDWSPYSDGYWSYGSRGYFWVSHEPWGWAPYHYGRWGYYGGSWCWIPGRVFGGAWVAWSWGSLYVGWSPLGYWNTAYCGWPWAYSYGYYSPSWSFISYNHFGYHSYGHHVVHHDHIDGHHLTDTAVVTRPPRVAPSDLAKSPEARKRAKRLANEDRVAHLRPVDQEERGTRNNLRGAERRLMAERGARVDAMRERTQPPGSGSKRGGPIAADRDSNRNRDNSGNPRATRLGASDLTLRNGLSNGLVRRDGNGRPGSSGNTVTERKAVRPAEGPSRTRATRGTRGVTPRADSAETRRQRMREVYESMSGPRSTRARRGTSTSGSRPKATPTRVNGGSRPKASPSRSSGGSRPKAAPSRKPGSSRPKASPSRNSGSSRPKAAPSRSSGGSRPKASPSRNSGGSRPKASSSRGSRGSRSSGSKSSGKKKDRS